MGEDHHDLERYSLNLASSCLSLFGSAAIIINYLIFTNKSQLLYTLIFFLSVADLGGSLAISISQILVFLDTYHGFDYSWDMCKVFRAAINFFFVSSFFWTAAIALHIWVCARQKAQIPIYYFHIVCWGVPAICTAILVATGMIVKGADSGWCSNTVLGHWLFWYIPLFLSFLWNAIAYTLILLHYRGGAAQADRRGMKKKIQIRVSLYLFVFFICWIWDIINFAVQQIHGSSPFWLQLLTSAFLPLQGFLNFLVYGLSSRMFTRRTTNKHSSLRRGFAINEERQSLMNS